MLRKYDENAPVLLLERIAWRHPAQEKATEPPAAEANSD